MLKFLGKKTSSLSPILDPFKSDKVDSISFRLHSWGKEQYWKGTVTFKNGNTSGEYTTKEYKPDEFENCVRDIENAIKSTAI
jgi:hypothetical protein